MEGISFFLIVLSLLQNFIITLFVYVLLSLTIKDKRFFILIVLTTFVQLIVRILPVTPFVITLAGLLIYIFYLAYNYRISKLIIAMTASFSILVFMIVESNITNIIGYFFNLSIYDIVSSISLRLLFSLIQIVIMSLIIFIIKYSRFNIFNYIGFLKDEDIAALAGGEVDFFRERKITHTFYLVIVFLIIQGIFINLYIWGEDLLEYFNVQTIFNQPVFINSIIIAFNIILLFLLRYLIIAIRIERNDTINRIKEKNSLRLDWEKRAQMHDRNHHLSMLYILLQLNKIDRAKEYLTGMVGEIQNVDAIVKSGNPALNALIKSKIAFGKKYGVTVNITVKKPLQEMNILDWDLNRVIGNLLDNAIEAIDNKGGSGEVELIIDGGELENRIEVITYGIIIPDKIKYNIFQKGYTSKEEKGHGLGLAICKELLDTYQGEINIKTDNNNNFTSFQLSLPVITA